MERLPLIKPAIRTKSASTMGAILTRNAELLSSQPSLADDALAALRAVASTALAPEDPALSKSVPKVIEIVKASKSSSTVTSAMSLLELTAYVLSLKLLFFAVY